MKYSASSALADTSLNQVALGPAGVGFRCKSPDVDYTTLTGKLMMTVMGGVAEFQSAQTGEHIKKAQRQRVHLGLPIATRPPFGYDPPLPTAEGKRQRGVPTPNATEAPAVLQMFTMKANRITQRKIADWLNAEEFRTRNRHGDG